MRAIMQIPGHIDPVTTGTVPLRGGNRIDLVGLTRDAVGGVLVEAGLDAKAAKLRAKSIANLDAQIAAYEARVARGEMYDSSKGEVIEAKVTTLKRELTRMKSSGKAGTQPTGPSRSLLFVLGVVVFALAAIFVGGAQGQPAVEVKAKGKPMKPVKAKKR